MGRAFFVVSTRLDNKTALPCFTLQLVLVRAERVWKIATIKV
jgi:hypothetical protein